MALGKDLPPKQDGGLVIGTLGGAEKPTGLLTAISAIENYAMNERESGSVPHGFFTTQNRVSFFAVGFTGGLVSGLVAALLTPIAIGVIENYIPIFGSHEPSLYDQCFAFAVSLSFSLGYAAFISRVRGDYVGTASKSAINNLVSGLATGAVLKLIIALVGFHFMYFVVLAPQNIGPLLLKLHPLVKLTTLEWWFQWLGEFRHVFLISSYVIVLTTFLTVATPVVAIMLSVRGSRRRKMQEKKWG